MRAAARLTPRPLPVLLLLLALGTPAPAAEPPHRARDAFGAEATLLTSHVRSQRGAPVRHYARRLDEHGTHVLTPGLELYYDRALTAPWLQARHVRLAAGRLSDSALHELGYVAVMGRWLLREGPRLDVSLQLGPGLLYRESWRDLPGYEGHALLNETDDFLPGYEWAVLPLGDLDLAWRLTPGLQAVWSIFPGLPYVVMQSVGVRWEF